MKRDNIVSNIEEKDLEQLQQILRMFLIII